MKINERAGGLFFLNMQVNNLMLLAEYQIHISEYL